MKHEEENCKKCLRECKNMPVISSDDERCKHYIENENREKSWFENEAKEYI